MKNKQNLSWSEYVEKVLGVPLSSSEKQLFNTMRDFYEIDPETYKERYFNLIATKLCSKNSRFNFIPLLLVMDSIFGNEYKTESED